MATTPPPPPSRLADIVATHLAPYVGPHTARVAVKTFAQKAVGRGPETLTYKDMPALMDALRPMLRTLLGKAAGEAAVAAISKEVGL